MIIRAALHEVPLAFPKMPSMRLRLVCGVVDKISGSSSVPQTTESLLTYLLTYLFAYLRIYLLTYLPTAIEFSPGGSSPYTSTDKTHKNKKIYIIETIQKHRTNNTKHSKCKYT